MDDDGAVAAPHVLFLVDLCYAGTITSLQWQSHIPDEDRRAWVIAGTAQHDPAYGGRFTRAVNLVLGRIAAGALDVSPLYPYVPIEKVAREIRREVDRLAEGSYQQRVVSIRSDPASLPYFPFIPNPAYEESPETLRMASGQLDEMARPFLDEVDEALDWRHFASRAAGGGRPAGVDLTKAGAFAAGVVNSRPFPKCSTRQRRRPAWFWSREVQASGSRRCSALSSAIHPELSDVTEPLWRDHRDHLPAVHEGLVAVHCRQRHLHEIVESIAARSNLRFRRRTQRHSLRPSRSGAHGLPSSWMRSTSRWSRMASCLSSLGL